MFGNNGLVLSALGTAARAAAVALDASGRAVVVGSVSVAGQSRNFGVARYTLTGALDATFGTNGVVLTDFNGDRDEARGVLIQPDGKIVVVGESVLPNQGSRVALARYLPTGALDLSFDTDGKVTTDATPDQDMGSSVARQADGKLVVSAYQFGFATDFCTLRYTVAGALDPAFGGDGKVFTSVATENDVAFRVLVQADQKIVVAGYGATTGNITTNDAAFVRYLPTGALDTSFGTGGIAVRPMALGTDDRVYDIVQQPDGKLVAIGFALVGSRSVASVRRLLPTGAVDGSFGTNGLAQLPGSSFPTLGEAVALQADGKIVVAGSRAGAQAGELLLARFLSTGALDPAFGTGGSVSTPGPGATLLGAKDLVIQVNGRLLTAGEGAANATPAFVVARYLPGTVTGGAEAERTEISTVFPNPALGTAPLTLTLNTPHGTTLAVRLYDGTGWLVRELRPAAPLLAGAHRLPLAAAALAPGCYWVGIETAEGRALRRLVITP
ncbi:MAG: hypothetical protein H7330_16195 [Hymenobacteraceae bacterium]|nr:hypothetical protein [Hymenobacteraceae bacterium]